MLLQASVAVAIPVLVVLVSAGQSKVMSIGQVITGGVVSRNSNQLMYIRSLPHTSVAVYFLRINSSPGQLGVAVESS